MNIKKHKILNGSDHGGYVRYGLINDDGALVNKLGHILVAISFLPNPNGKRTVNHKNKIRSDNRMVNLEWATHSEQNKHKCNYSKHRGRPVYQLDNDRQILRKWDKTVDAASSLRISRSNISTVCKNGNKLGGYRWAYADEYDGNLLDEKWRAISNSKSFISSYGRFKCSTGKITYGNMSATGYLSISLETTTEARKPKRIHVLVAEAFLGKQEGKVVNHIDGNPHNNYLTNLEYVTQRENILHAIKTGLRDYSISKFNKKAVIQFSKTGEKIGEFESLAEASRITGISQGNICSVCKGDRHYAKGFIWYYKE